jgi:hypothetical protein
VLVAQAALLVIARVAELETVQAEALGLVIGRAPVAEVLRAEEGLVIARVEELELGIAPVVAELELVQAEVVPALDHPRVRLVVALRTKSVTAAHHRGLLLLAVVDSAAAAVETMRERAAAEVATAWGVADTAVAAGGIVVAAEVE